jgi:hypothetical protein
MIFKRFILITKVIVLLHAQCTLGAMESFDPCDPRADLRLHPAKGATVFVRTREVSYSYTYFGKRYAVDYPESHEITFSYPAGTQDLFKLCEGLLSFDTEKQGHEEISTMTVTVDATDYHGFSVQDALMFTDMNILKGSKDNLISLMRNIENRAFLKGIRRVHGNIFADDILLQEALTVRGFIKDTEVLDLKTGRYFFPVFKELHASSDHDALSPYFRKVVTSELN